MRGESTQKGLTLLEILLSIVIVTTILVYAIPQQLKSSHEKLVNKTVSQMNQLVLAARNYYQDHRSSATDNPSAWPSSLSQLTTTESYLPRAALCSAWPKGDSTQQSKANNNGNDCSNHQEYALFPANSNGVYDTTLVGIKPNGSNGGGNFWGVSLTLPSAKAAQDIRERLPFSTLCNPDALITSNTTGQPCTQSGSTVTVLVPRPAAWPTIYSHYAQDGLIQTLGSIVVCNDSSGCNDNNHFQTTIPMPTNCDTGLIPALFVYPLNYRWRSGSGSYPGIYLRTIRSRYGNSDWNVQIFESGANNGNNAKNFNYLSIGYFTTCQPENSVTGSWDPTWSAGKS